MIVWGCCAVTECIVQDLFAQSKKGIIVVLLKTHTGQSTSVSLDSMRGGCDSGDRRHNII